MEADCALSGGACAFIRLKVNAKTYQAITFNVFVDSSIFPGLITVSSNSFDNKLKITTSLFDLETII